MSIALVQSVLSNNASQSFPAAGGTITVSGNFPVDTTPGNFLLAVAFGQTTTQTPGITFSLTGGGVWNVGAGGANSNTGGAQWKGALGFRFIGNAASIPHTTPITLQTTFGAVALAFLARTEFCLFEFSGIRQVAGPVDNSDSNSGSNSTPGSSIAIPTTAADLIVGAVVAQDSNPTAGSGFTIAQTTALVQFGVVEYALNVPAGNVNVPWGSVQTRWGTAAEAVLPPVGAVTFRRNNLDDIPIWCHSYTAPEGRDKFRGPKP